MILEIAIGYFIGRTAYAIFNGVLAGVFAASSSAFTKYKRRKR